MNDIRHQPPTHEEIALAAYAIWDREGRPHGRDVIHWIQAEQQLFLAPPQAAISSPESAARPGPLARPPRRRSRANRRLVQVGSAT